MLPSRIYYEADMTEDTPSFSIEKDKVGLGSCVIAVWPDGRRIVVTGFGSEAQARDWVDRDATEWMKNIPTDPTNPQWTRDIPPRA
jgi:hypothetical protein